LNQIATPKPKPLARAAKGRKPQYFADPATDKLLSMVLVLTQELSVARDRIDTLERLLDRAGVLSAQTVDDYLPTAEEAAARSALRSGMLRRVFRAAEKEAQDLERHGAAASAPEMADMGIVDILS
jgi:hypothetical protein